MINSRQFYINRTSNKHFEDWETITLKNQLYIHYQKELNIVFSSDRIVLLGYAWQVDPNRQSPEKELGKIINQENISKEQIYEIEKTWCGRYILIVDDWLYLDTVGSLGVFYNKRTISSSLNVLCSIEERDITYPPIRHLQLPDFFPGMRTPYQDTSRLLPSQILNIKDLQISFRPLIVDSVTPIESTENRHSLFTKYFTHSIHNLYQLFSDSNIELALTGGRDSRAIMALIEKAKIPYHTFTLWHENISDADRIIPSRLAKFYHRRHQFIHRKERDFSQLRHNKYQEHTAGMAVDCDWDFYAYGQYQQLISDNKPVLLIRSGVWELTCEYYTMNDGERAKDIQYIFPNLQDNELFSASVEEWKSSISQDPYNNNLTEVTRIYWDLRGGCWLSSIEQSFDLIDNLVSIQPLNCRLFISLLLGFETKDRITKRHEETLVSFLSPELAKIPYDYQYRSNRQKIANILSRIKRIRKKLSSFVKNKVKIPYLR